MPHPLRSASVLASLALVASCTRSGGRAAPDLGSQAALPTGIQAVAAGDARWGPGPEPGVRIAVLWGAPEREAAGGERYRFEPGSASPEHTHPFHERVVVLAGAFSVTPSGREPLRLGPGSYFFVPAGARHATRCEGPEACELYNEVIPR